MNEANNRSTDEAQIRDLVEGWARAVCSQEYRWNSGQPFPGDIDVRRSASGPIEGNGSLQKDVGCILSWFQDSGVFDISELDITAGDDVALPLRCAGTEANGDKIELDFRLTICFRKIDERWTVMHEHHSVPAS